MIDPILELMWGDVLNYCIRNNIDLKTLTWEQFEKEIYPEVVGRRREQIIADLFAPDPILQHIEFKPSSEPRLRYIKPKESQG